MTGTGLVLQNNGADDLAVFSNGTFTFSSAIANGGAYNVTVKTQPASPSQTCTASANTGPIAGANITSVSVVCSMSAFTVGGTVTGFSGSGLVLQNNGGSDLNIFTNGAFAFAAPVADGAGYNVTVKTQPPGQTCVAGSHAGTIAGANVTNVAVTCSANPYTVGGTVSGLGEGKYLIARNNTLDEKQVSANGSFTFVIPLAEGAAYSVDVKSQPNGQICQVTNGSGTISGSSITSVVISCSDIPSYTIGGTVSGLTGTIVLQNNSGDDATITANGSYAFAAAAVDGASYFVTIKTQPAGQICNVNGGSGTVSGANVTSAAVVCVTNAPGSYSIRGTVSGIAGSGLVLRNNGGDDLAISANGSFVFSTTVTDGGAYAVTVKSQPACPIQMCTVASGSGTVSGGDVSGITVTCAQDEIRLFTSNTGDTSLKITDDIAGFPDNATAGPRVISGGNTMLTSLNSFDNLAVDRTRDLLYVANGGNQILIFSNASAASGNVAPARTVSVSGSSLSALAVDSKNDRVYAGKSNRILVFNNASGMNGTLSGDQILTTATTAQSGHCTWMKKTTGYTQAICRAGTYLFTIR